ncbi:MAG TPA: sigma 54-interacting transcriptional regulator [Vicinamibacteria bacterium]|nr:sigma 54-interacting transcriptional regulator [Vicinamibacteria bacterium]
MAPSTRARLSDPDAALTTLVQVASPETGRRFFETFVESLARALDVHGAWVTEYSAERRRLRALAFWAGGRLVPDYEYDIAGTPCERVVNKACFANFPEGVVDLFPADSDLRAFRAVSYMGVPLLDLEGTVLGNLAVIDTKPMPEEPRLIAVFRLFGERAAAELRRLRAETAIRELTGEAEYLREEIRTLHDPDQLLGRSPGLLEVRREIAQVAPTDTTVLILGETGTGKELVARALHGASRRRDRPLIVVNCAAIPASLIESEFFGHEKGAFTGATARREGRFALANGGTIFLDEIGELPLDLQPKLLRVLQEGEFEPVGGSHTRRVDVRVIAATNRDLDREVQDGRFRQDLYYRLNVFPLRVPPLRDRPEDVTLLASSFVRRFARKLGRPFEPLGLDAMARLRAYAWPGNVRELQNVMERAMVASRDGRLNLDRALPDTAPSIRDSPEATAEGSRILTLREMRELERANLVRALEASQWRIAGADGAARRLGMKPSTLNSRLKALGIRRPQ